jgi:hypothetical protein
MCKTILLVKNCKSEQVLPWKAYLDLDLKGLQSSQIEIVPILWFLATQMKVGAPPAQRMQCTLRFQSRQGSAKTEVGAGAKRDVFISRTSHVKAIRIGELRRIPVGSADNQI